MGGKFRTGIQFFLLYRNEVSYKAKKGAEMKISSIFFCRFKQAS